MKHHHRVALTRRNDPGRPLTNASKLVYNRPIRQSLADASAMVHASAGYTARLGFSEEVVPAKSYSALSSRAGSLGGQPPKPPDTVLYVAADELRSISGACNGELCFSTVHRNGNVQARVPRGIQCCNQKPCPKARVFWNMGKSRIGRSLPLPSSNLIRMSNGCCVCVTLP